MMTRPLPDREKLAAVYRYTIAGLATLVAVWVRHILDPWLHEECPFSLFYLSVLATAWLAGMGPALLAIGPGTFCAACFLIVPQSSFAIASLSEFIQVAIFVVVNCIAAVLFGRLEASTTSGKAAFGRKRTTEQVIARCRRKKGRVSGPPRA
jgi:two-component system CheB/CheR fusion protein